VTVHSSAGDFALAGGGDAWTGEFPEVVADTVITYSVEATFDDGSLQTLPNNEADPRYQLYVGETTPIWCESFDANPAWDHTGPWQWGAPSTQISPDPDAAHTGSAVLGLDVTDAGYYLPSTDATLTTPMITIPPSHRVHLQYWRWLTVEDATYDEATISANGTEVWRNASNNGGTLDHVDREWRFHDVDVTEQARSGSLQLSWSLASDTSKELGGWTLDDVCVVGVVLPSDTCDDCEIVAGGGGCDVSSGGAGGLAVLIVVGALGRRRRR
jgi:MYXO-CTERM domain-containing protein